MNLILHDDYCGTPSDYPGSQLECQGPLRLAHAPFLASQRAAVADILLTNPAIINLTILYIKGKVQWTPPPSLSLSLYIYIYKATQDGGL